MLINQLTNLYIQTRKINTLIIKNLINKDTLILNNQCPKRLGPHHKQPQIEKLLIISDLKALCSLMNNPTLFKI